jgi:hypothetical protein
MNIFQYKDLPKIIQTPTMSGPITIPLENQGDWYFGGQRLSSILESKDRDIGPRNKHMWRTFCSDQFAVWSHHLDLSIDGEDPDFPDIWETKDQWMELYLEASR